MVQCRRRDHHVSKIIFLHITCWSRYKRKEQSLYSTNGIFLMKFRSLLLSLLGALLFLAGVLAGLLLSAAVVWGESEARIYTSYNGERRLKVQCPLMLSPVESAAVGANIINSTNEEIKPV